MFSLSEGQHRFTETLVLDEPGDGGAYHEYNIVDINDKSKSYSKIKFQKGPVKENGVNGIFIEDLIWICIHRLACFQKGNFACKENSNAKEYLQKALDQLNNRTKERQNRNVEGTSQL
jgi:hypothetical protein